MKLFYLFLITIFWSCSTVRVVKPLEKGVTEVGFTAGGPIIGFSNTIIPIPMSSIYGSHGITDRLTGFGGVNTTSLLFGVGQLDLGTSYGFLKQDGLKPGLVGTGAFNLMLDRWEWNFRAYPQLDLHTYWDYKHGKGTLYSGVSNWFELRRRALHGLEQEQYWVPNFYLGTKLNGKKLNWMIESRYIAPNYKNDYTVVDFKGLGRKGAFGLYLGVSKVF